MLQYQVSIAFLMFFQTYITPHMFVPSMLHQMSILDGKHWSFIFIEIY